MHRTTRRPGIRWILLAAVLAMLALSSSAQAAGKQIASTNSGRVLQAERDGHVTVVPSNLSNLRQRWTPESAGGGMVRYRNDAQPNDCLITPSGATADSVNELVLGKCFGLGARNVWSSLSSTTGLNIRSAQTGQLISEPLCIDSSPCDTLARVVPASFAPLDFILRWRLK